MENAREFRNRNRSEKKVKLGRKHQVKRSQTESNVRLGRVRRRKEWSRQVATYRCLGQPLQWGRPPSKPAANHRNE